MTALVREEDAERVDLASQNEGTLLARITSKEEETRRAPAVHKKC
jgi:hypothetical protein